MGVETPLPIHLPDPVDDSDEALRRDRGQVREDLEETVNQLWHKFDVKGRMGAATAHKLGMGRKAGDKQSDPASQSFVGRYKWAIVGMALSAVAGAIVGNMLKGRERR